MCAARTTGGASEAAQDARVFGADEETVALIEEAERGGTDGEIEVWAQHWDIVVAFCAVFSQWRVVALAAGPLHYIGLDYTAARAGLDAAGIAVTPRLWDGIRTMESAARQAMNAR